VSSSDLGYIGSYRLLNVVHTGAASQIWLTFNDGEGQKFGLKVVKKEFSKDREQIGYLRREYAVGQAARHKRLIDVKEMGTDKGIAYLAMEWYGAPNMKHRIRQGNEAIAHLLPKIILQAAEGLSHLNHIGWIHCDVKPHNFLIRDDGQVKLIDFALARRPQRGIAKFLSRKNKLQGTPSYMAPEQIRGGAVDERTDVYGFGCTIFELMVGTPPFTGISSNELLNKHLRAPPPVLESVDKNITPEFSQLIRRSMAKKPADRPKSMEAFVDEFRLRPVFKRAPKPPQQTSQ